MYRNRPIGRSYQQGCCSGSNFDGEFLPIPEFMEEDNFPEMIDDFQEERTIETRRGCRPFPPFPPPPRIPRYIDPCASSREQLLFIYQQLATSYAGLTATIITFDGTTLTGVISGAINPFGALPYIVITVAGITYNILIERIAYIDIVGATAQTINFNPNIRQTTREIQLQQSLIGTHNLIFIGSPATFIDNATTVNSYPGITVFTYFDGVVNHVIYATFCSIIAFS